MIRLEQPGDIEAIYRVNAIAFSREHEAKGDRRRGLPDPLSLVAVVGDAIVGHIFFSFSPVTFDEVNADTGLVLGLGPVAMRPDHQHRGIKDLENSAIAVEMP